MVSKHANVARVVHCNRTHPMLFGFFNCHLHRFGKDMETQACIAIKIRCHVRFTRNPYVGGRIDLLITIHLHIHA